ncbi:efflux transporter outer membrane subunit [Pareuzebyella sediminis]|uniref:efflux transporter outer membrane subunit n=1 Tax=Pareuzebyella sediminis TaxID=2607998 RepID=UPI0011EFACC0|nr:efflux transporter outer membrane subunit [Pareuzebyella sediminis]
MKIFQSYRFLLISALPLLLVSCFAAKNYERPEMEEVNELYRTDRTSTDTVSMANVSWRDLFIDPDLTGYIEEGLQNNLDIRIAIQQINAAEAYLKQGKVGYFPSLETSVGLTHQELSRNSQFGSFFSGAIQQYQLTANLSWEADIWGKIRSNRRATRASYLRTVAAQQAVKTRLVSEISITYYQLLALDQQYRITEQTIENRKRSLETIEALKDAGNVTQVAIDQTAAQLYNAQALLIDLEKNIFRTENALAILLGKPVQHFERSSLQEQKIDIDLQIGLSTLLLRNRPDVIAAEYDLINTFELTNVARSNFYPSFTISATGGFQSLEFDKWFNSASLFATLVGNLAQPIFNRRKIRTQYEVAESQQQQSLLNFKKTLLTAGQEVSNALFDFEAEREKYEFRQKEVEALRKAESNSEILLNNGFANYLDLLTARQAALSAELNVVNNKLNQLQAIVSLYRALGGGWR